MFKKTDSIISKIEVGLAFLSGLALAILMLLITIDVIGRSLRIISIPWTVEVSQYWLIAGTFLSAGWLYREHAHPRIGVIDEVKIEKLKLALKFLSTVLTVVACAFGLYFATEIIMVQFSRGTDVGTFIRIPRWIVLSPLFIGFLFLLYESIRGGFVAEESADEELEMGEQGI